MNKMYMHLHMNNKALNGSNCELRFVFPIDMQWITMDSCSFICFFVVVFVSNCMEISNLKRWVWTIEIQSYICVYNI